MTSSAVRIGITGVGAVLAEQEVSTTQVQARVCATSGLDLPEGLFEQLTGIRTRRMALDHEYASTFAIQAGQDALKDAGLIPDEIDLLLYASASRDIVEPATGHIVQAELGTRAHCLDVTNACNSFLNGIDLARSMLLAGRARRALVVTGETPTRAARWQVDSIEQARASFAGYTFGDGGAAVVLEQVEQGGIVDVDAVAHSEHWEVGGVFGGGSRHPRGEEHTYFTGDGRLLREQFERVGADIVERTWQRTGMGWDDVKHVLVHQVTVPYLERFVAVTGAPPDKLIPIVESLGNLASASLGVQLARVHADLGPGERVLLVGLGGGISLMTMVLEGS